MRHLLLASTCVIALAAPLHAETKIETATSAAVKTSTIKSGTPDDILITTAGSINSTTVPVAVTVDSNNKLTNQGTIQIGNVNGAIGVSVNAGVIGGITNSGKIVIDEPYTPTDGDNDGDLDGPLALGSGRYGILTNGAFTGNIVNSGTITVEGNNSAGIMLNGPLTGNLTHNGVTTVTGNNSVGVGMADVTGNVRLAGSISATGQGSVAIRSAGNVTGAVEIQGTIVSTGYRFLAPPADPSKLDADDLLQGGPAVSIEGDVTKGIILATPPKDASTTDNDEDDDGIEDSKEGTAVVTSYGAAPAMRIGKSGEAVAIGPVAGTATGFGLIVDGTIAGDGIYTGIDGNGLLVGNGGTVTIANGIGIGAGGVVSAKSLDRAATALRLGAGSTTPELRNAGRIVAAGGKTANSVATAVAIDAGANLPVIRNSNVINSVAGGVDGTAIAIVDKSGTVGLVENSGTISATGAAATSTRNVAIDLSANSTGATVRQTVVAATFAAPSMIGDVRFGSGSDLLDVADGKLSGNVSFGTGSNRYQLSGDAVAVGNASFGNGADTLSLLGSSAFTGNVDFGGGADVLGIGGTSVFSGQVTNATGLAVSVSQGTFNVMKNASIASLDVTSGGTIGVVLDKTAGASSSLTVAGTASFAADSKLQLKVANVAQAEGDYVVLTAGSVVGGDKLSATTTLLPFMYKGSLGVGGNQVTVNIARKNALELGLNNSETAAYGAIYEALGSDAVIGNSFLAIGDQSEFLSTLRQMLPDHAGGAFEAVTAGDRAVARMLNDPAAPYKQQGRVTFWLGQVAWGSSKDLGSTAGFKVGGWGATAGAELETSVGKFGGALSYLAGKNDDRETDNSLRSDQYGAAAHWRLNKGGFQAMVRGGWNHIGFDGERFFSSDATGTRVEKTMSGKWDGTLTSATGHVAQQLWAGSWYVRPSAGVEYYRLSEDGYQEKGGGTALDLSVDRRKSDELAVNGLLAAGYEMAPSRDYDGYFTVEVEAGRRQIVGGELGATVARFDDGDDFTLVPEDRKSGWVGRLRALGGGAGFRMSGEVGAEERESRVALSARVGLVLGL